MPFIDDLNRYKDTENAEHNITPCQKGFVYDLLAIL